MMTIDDLVRQYERLCELNPDMDTAASKARRAAAEQQRREQDEAVRRSLMTPNELRAQRECEVIREEIAQYRATLTLSRGRAATDMATAEATVETKVETKVEAKVETTATTPVATPAAAPVAVAVAVAGPRACAGVSGVTTVTRQGQVGEEDHRDPEETTPTRNVHSTAQQQQAETALAVPFAAIKGGLHSYFAVQQGEVAPKTGQNRRSQDRAEPVTGDDLLDLVVQLHSLAPHLAVPASLRDALVEWRPELGTVEGFMAMVQLVLFSSRVDHAGVSCDFATLYRSFGLDRTARNEGVYSGSLLDLYRDRVDPHLDVLGHSTQQHLARKITAHGIPQAVLDIATDYALNRSSYTDRVYLITGKSANRRNSAAAILKTRMTDSQTQTPTVPAPRSAQLIQSYLNGCLNAKLFTQGPQSTASRVPEARRLLEELRTTPAFSSDGKYDSASRSLVWLAEHPVPVYLFADRSPRLKADAYNPLMNTQGTLRRALYSDGDVELDLEKAHMAALARIARDRGMVMPLLEAALDASLDGTLDFWASLADRFDAVAMPDAAARKKTAKTVYAAVYGSGENNMTFEMLKRYKELTGDFPDSAAVRGVYGHPVVAEILSVRDELLATIDADGGMVDCEGRLIETRAWSHKKESDRARGVLSYACASYEQTLVAAAFGVAIEEHVWSQAQAGRKLRFKIWLYQADGFTLRISPKQAPAPIIEKLQRAVAKKAEELGLKTRLDVQYRAT